MFTHRILVRKHASPGRALAVLHQWSVSAELFTDTRPSLPSFIRHRKGIHLPGLDTAPYPRTLHSAATGLSASLLLTRPVTLVAHPARLRDINCQKMSRVPRTCLLRLHSLKHTYAAHLEATKFVKFVKFAIFKRIITG